MPANWRRKTEATFGADYARVGDVAFDPSKRCSSCFLQLKLCMCSEVSLQPCDLEIVIVRHARESERSSNTGRLVGAAFENARVLDYAHPERPLDRSTIVGPGSVLLYPNGTQSDLSEPPNRLVVLDATWSQARRMAHRIVELRGMPSLALPAPIFALPRLRKGLEPEQMSTAEAVVAALRFLGHQASADHLEALLRELVRRFALSGHKQAPRALS